MTYKPALEADARLAAKNALKIRAALAQSFDARWVYDQYLETNPIKSGNLAQDRARARAWVMLNVRVNLEALKEVMLRVWAEGYVTGEAFANQQLAYARERKKATDTDIDWANWRPGDRAAALILRPPDAFKKLLESQGITFKEFSDTTVRDIGNAVGEAIELGLPAQRSAKRIKDHVASASRALSIAITEQNRAISFATVNRYKDAGLEKMEWEVSSPCDKCAQNANQVVAIGGTFNSGATQPPQHPHCRCVLLPVLPDFEEHPIAGNMTAPPTNIVPIPGAKGIDASIIEADIQALKKEFAGDVPIREILSDSYAYEDEWLQLYRGLAKTYREKGLGATNADLAAKAKLTRISYYIENEKAKEEWFNQLDKWAEDKDFDATQDIKNNKDNLAFATQTITDAMKNAKITVAIDRYSLEEVIRDGRFKNQFETKKSGGALNSNVRKEGEAIILDVPITAPAKKRPIYGYLTNNNKPSIPWKERNKELSKSWQEILSLDNEGVEQYGLYKVILKDTVRPSTTVTIGDSLRTGNLAESIMNPNPDLTQMGLYKKGAPTHMGGFPAMNYLEVQISDVVTVQDIAAIYVPKGDADYFQRYLTSKNLDITVLEIGTE